MTWFKFWEDALVHAAVKFSKFFGVFVCREDSLRTNDTAAAIKVTEERLRWKLSNGALFIFIPWRKAANPPLP